MASTVTTSNDVDVDDQKARWKDQIHPDFHPLVKPISFPGPTYDAWWKVKALNALMHIPGPTAHGVSSKKIRSNGAVVGRLYFPTAAEQESPSTARKAALWIHGGGRVMGAAGGASESAICSKLVQRLGVPVLSARYRLAPKHPFPAALDDVVAAYEWLLQHLRSSGNNDNENEVKVVVAGESAGGGLAAELCQRLLDESRMSGDNATSLVLPAVQLLVYPMLDDKTCVREELMDSDHIIWNNRSNTYAWSAYLGPDCAPGDDLLPKYAAASRRQDLSDLPPAWVMVGDLDLFLEECKDYACRLEKYDVETHFVEVEGGFHGFFALGKEEKAVLNVWDSLTQFGRRFLYDTSVKAYSQS